MYSKGQACPACVLAKETLSNKNIPFKEIMVGKDITKEQMVDIVLSKTGRTVNTVPQIFKVTNNDEAYIGGSTDLVEHLKPKEKVDFKDFTL